MSDATLPKKVRRMRRQDENFVLNSWLKSLYSSKPYDSWITSKAWHKHHQEEVLGIIHRPSTETLICVIPTEDDAILGWASFSGNSLEYAYTKSMYRNCGVLHALIDAYLGESAKLAWYLEYTGPKADAIMGTFGLKYKQRNRP